MTEQPPPYDRPAAPAGPTSPQSGGYEPAGPAQVAACGADSRGADEQLQKEVDGLESRVSDLEQTAPGAGDAADDLGSLSARPDELESQVPELPDTPEQ